MSRCYNCGEFANHIAAKCTMGPQPKRCHNCKSEDHLIADCPSRPERSKKGSKSQEEGESDDEDDEGEEEEGVEEVTSQMEELEVNSDEQ